MASLPELSRQSVEELEAALSARGLDTEGKKYTLVQRLLKAMGAEGTSGGEAGGGAATAPAAELEAATVDPYAATDDPYAVACDDPYAAADSGPAASLGDSPTAASRTSRATRKRPRSARAAPEGEEPEVGRIVALRRLADDLGRCGLKEMLNELDAALARGGVASKMMTSLEAKLSTAIDLIEAQNAVLGQ
mmetsp:Transcript_88059/g.247532  ORF Transcript_88059/g.247532 Transcript_88059/m.247532 type:complete len:192 (-) Transcript_88059:114-689(-)